MTAYKIRVRIGNYASQYVEIQVYAASTSQALQVAQAQYGANQVVGIV